MEQSSHLQARTASAPFAIAAQGIARRFGARWVLTGVSLQCAAGEAVGLLGANGSGKSTLLRILATLLTPNAGTASVVGHDVVKDAQRVRGEIGFLAHVPGLYDDLTARENLAFVARMRGLPETGLDAALERVGLSSVTHERVRGFSAGMQRRLAMARLLLAHAPVLLLDEPYSNLDTNGIALMNDIIREATGRGGCALIVVHELAPAAQILDRTVTIVNGRLDATLAHHSRDAVLATAGAS
jgi:heme exporter protein A